MTRLAELKQDSAVRCGFIQQILTKSTHKFVVRLGLWAIDLAEGVHWHGRTYGIAKKLSPCRQCGKEITELEMAEWFRCPAAPQEVSRCNTYSPPPALPLASSFGRSSSASC